MTKTAVVDIIINVQTQVISPGHELIDPQAMDHMAREL